MSTEIFLLAYEGVDGSGNVVEFENQNELDKFKKSCLGGSRQITTEEFESEAFCHDTFLRC